MEVYFPPLPWCFVTEVAVCWQRASNSGDAAPRPLHILSPRFPSPQLHAEISLPFSRTQRWKNWSSSSWKVSDTFYLRVRFKLFLNNTFVIIWNCNVSRFCFCCLSYYKILIATNKCKVLSKDHVIYWILIHLFFNGLAPPDSFQICVACVLLPIIISNILYQFIIVNSYLQTMNGSY